MFRQRAKELQMKLIFSIILHKLPPLNGMEGSVSGCCHILLIFNEFFVEMSRL